MSFKFIQLFYLDSAAVQGAAEAGISRIDLYCRSKPRATGNKSGIEKPGVELSILPAYNGIPIINEVGTIRPNEPTEHGARFSPRFEISRKEWDEITASDTATVATSFEFSNPIFCKTNQEYGIVVKCDGMEDYNFWYAKLNHNLVGTTKKYTGAGENYVGKLFTYIGSPNLDVNNLSPESGSNQTNNNVPQTTTSNEYNLANWKPNNEVELKFKLHVARYFHNKVSVASNNTLLNSVQYKDRFAQDFKPINLGGGVTRLISPAAAEEYIKFDSKNSNLSDLVGGGKAYQVAPHYPGGRATPLTVRTVDDSSRVVANGSYIMPGGNTFAASNGWYSVFPNFNGSDSIVIDNGNYVSVREVKAIINSTAIMVNQPLLFTNNNARFMKTAVGDLSGLLDSYFDGGISDMAILSSSSANSTIRFVNNSINSTSIVDGGTGYSNTDHLVLNGFESVANKVVGGYPAKANLVTNSTGGVTAIHFSNIGCGYVNEDWLTGANVQILNSSNTASDGTGLDVDFIIGTTIKLEASPASWFANCLVTNIEATRVKPEITVNNPLGTNFDVSHKSLFYSVPDGATYAGKITRIYENSESTLTPVKIFKSTDTGREFEFNSVIPSRSNQLVATFANGSTPSMNVIGNFYSNASVYYFDISSNNDYVCPFFEPEIINAHFSKYIINNDYTNEHTNYGAAFAKHVTTKVNFKKENRTAEDILVYVTAYRPQGADLKVYARVHNKNDPEAFDDKDWTLLEEIDGVGVFSSKTDPTDYIELTYNFQNCPNTGDILTGSLYVPNTTTVTLEGDGTLFETELANNDMIKISNPLFAANSFAAVVVQEVVNNTVIVINEPLSNNGLIGDGMRIEKIDFKNQAFNNPLNDYVVRYYNEDMAAFDGYDTFQIKVVMVSDNEVYVPKFDDIRGIGVTA